MWGACPSGKIKSMNITAIRQRPQWLVLGIVLMTAIGGGILRLTLAQNAASSSSESQTTPTADVVENEETAQLFQSPMITLSAELRKAAMPSELVSSTPSEDRLSVIAAGRPDPFAPVIQWTGILPQPSQNQSPNSAAPTVAVSTDREPISSALPTTSIARAPDLPPLPNPNAAPPALPSIPVASNPLPIPSLPSSIPQANPIPQSPIEALELTGVVQVGDRVGLIVRENNGQTSRHVFAGDLLAGGVRLKSIDLSAQEPLVILEYQGEEYTRLIG